MPRSENSISVQCPTPECQGYLRCPGGTERRELSDKLWPLLLMLFVSRWITVRNRYCVRCGCHVVTWELVKQVTVAAKTRPLVTVKNQPELPYER